MISKTQQYLEKRKKEMETKKVSESEKSPYMELLYEQVQKALVVKIKTLRGEDGHTPTEKEVMALVEPIIEKLKEKHIPKREEMLKMISSLIPKVQDGKPGIKGETGKDGKDGKDGINGRNGRDGKDAILPSLYKLAINTINVIESLEGEDRIDAKAIKNLEKLIRKIVSQETANFPYYNQGGPSIGSQQSSGGGFNIETPSGTIDGSNTTFTVLHTPRAVILNGMTYFQNDGYTLSGLIVTMLVVPETGSTLRSIY